MPVDKRIDDENLQCVTRSNVQGVRQRAHDSWVLAPEADRAVLCSGDQEKTNRVTFFIYEPVNRRL